MVSIYDPVCCFINNGVSFWIFTSHHRVAQGHPRTITAEGKVIKSCVHKPQPLERKPWRWSGTDFNLLRLLVCGVRAQCCFTSTETVRTVRDWGAQDGHLDFHTAPELWGLQFNVSLRPQRPRGAQDGHLDFFTQLLSSEAFSSMLVSFQETIRTVSDGEPRTATSTFTDTAPEL